VVRQHLSGGQEAVEVDLLRRDAEQEPGVTVSNCVVPEHEDLSARSPDEARRSSDQCRLPRAVRTEQAEERAGGYPELERVERMRPIRVHLREPIDEECAHIGHLESVRTRRARLLRSTRTSFAAGIEPVTTS
jgi:hypothetical protein